MAKSSTSFKPGETGNPNGRPRGTREKITGAFEAALLRDMERATGDTTEARTNLETAIAEMRKDRPAEYTRMLAGFSPKEMNYNGKMAHTLESQTFLKVLEMMNRRAELPPPAIDVTPNKVSVGTNTKERQAAE